MNFESAARTLGVPVAAIKAIAEVESKGEGFLPDGQPKILFEAHIFSRLTKGRYDKSHPDISSPKWNPKLYKGGAGEHRRLAKAVKLDRNAALMSASWGRFQIMGFNWKAAGFNSLQSFINAMYHDKEGLIPLVRLILNHPDMHEALRRLDFARFAYYYNGSGYAQHGYHTCIAAAYKKYLGEKK